MQTNRVPFIVSTHGALCAGLQWSYYGQY